MLPVFLCIGCASSEPIFRASFDDDTEGLPPDLTLPGDPAGDRLRTLGEGTIQVTQTGGLGSKSLRLEASDYFLLGLYSVPQLHFDSRYYITWRGRFEALEPEDYIRFSFGLTGIDLGFSGGNVFLTHRAGRRLGEGTVRLGPYTAGKEHTVLVIVDDWLRDERQKVSVRYQEDGLPPMVANDLPFEGSMRPGLGETPRYDRRPREVEVFLSLRARNGTQTYWIDDIMIHRRPLRD
jgi:hypothetical protein